MFHLSLLLPMLQLFQFLPIQLFQLLPIQLSLPVLRLSLLTQLLQSVFDLLQLVYSQVHYAIFSQQLRLPLHFPMNFELPIRSIVLRPHLISGNILHICFFESTLDDSFQVLTFQVVSFQVLAFQNLAFWVQLDQVWPDRLLQPFSWPKISNHLDLGISNPNCNISTNAQSRANQYRLTDQ